MTLSLFGQGRLVGLPFNLSWTVKEGTKTERTLSNLTALSQISPRHDSLQEHNQHRIYPALQPSPSMSETRHMLRFALRHRTYRQNGTFKNLSQKSKHSIYCISDLNNQPSTIQEADLSSQSPSPNPTYSLRLMVLDGLR